MFMCQNSSQAIVYIFIDRNLLLPIYLYLKCARVLLLISAPTSQKMRTPASTLPHPQEKKNLPFCSLTSGTLKDSQLAAVFAFLPYPVCSFSKSSLHHHHFTEKAHENHT